MSFSTGRFYTKTSIGFECFKSGCDECQVGQVGLN